MRFIWKCRRFCLLFCLVSFWKWKILLMLLTNNIDSTCLPYLTFLLMCSSHFLCFYCLFLIFLDSSLSLIRSPYVMCSVNQSNLTWTKQQSQQLHVNCTLLTANRPPTLSGNIQQPPVKPISIFLLWSWATLAEQSSSRVSSSEAGSVPKQNKPTKELHLTLLSSCDPAYQKECAPKRAERKQQKKQARGNKFCLFIFFEKNSAPKDLFLCYFWRLSHLTSNQILATSCERHPPEVSCNSEVSAKARSMTLKFLWKRDCTQ